MRPIDLRNATWSEVLGHITEDMARVHAAWQQHGPGTTRQVAERSGLSLLTLRPRTTDLYKLGLVELTDQAGNEGVYEYRHSAEALAAAVWRTRADFRQGRGRTRAEVDTVEAAIHSLRPEQQAALVYRLMQRFGHLLPCASRPARAHARAPEAGQLSFI